MSLSLSMYFHFILYNIYGKYIYEIVYDESNRYRYTLLKPAKIDNERTTLSTTI